MNGLPSGLLSPTSNIYGNPYEPNVKMINVK
jgi:hypothetical protein